MYLHIRSVFRAYGVPWDAQLPVHPLQKVILPTDNSVIFASVISYFLPKQSYKPLSITTIWSKDISSDLQTLLSDKIWETITSSSKKTNHQMIHWKLLHRLYLSPLKRFYMHVSPSPNCNLCPQRALGTYLHFWGECSALSLFWSQLAHVISFLLERDVDLTPDLFFLNNFSELALSLQQRNLLLAALTAAKKMLVSLWVPPHSVTRRVWGLSLLDIVSMELSTACIHGEKTQTLKTWNATFDIVKSFVSSF